MARASDVYSSFIKSDALGDGKGGYRTMILTIKGRPRTETFDDGKKQRVLSFVEDDRELGLNITNWNTIAEITGKDDDDYWDGTKIELYVDPHVKFGNKTMPGLRVRRPGGGGSGAGKVLGPAAARITDLLTKCDRSIQDLRYYLSENGYPNLGPNPMNWPLECAGKIAEFSKLPDDLRPVAPASFNPDGIDQHPDDLDLPF